MKYIIFISVYLLISSCNLNSSTCTLVPLTKEELSWFKDYKNGEKRLYKNQFGDIDTFQLRHFPEITTTQCNPIELGDYQYQWIDLYFDKLEKNNKIRAFSMHFSKDQQSMSEVDCIKRFMLFDLGTKAILQMNKIEQRSDTLLLTNSLIQVYHFNQTNGISDANYSNSRFKSFDVSNKFGLVSYETKKGEVFKYWKKI